MRKFYSLITMLMIVTIASSQNTYTWNNASGGDYQLETNWTPARSAGIIAASDILLFNLGSSYTVNNIPSQTVGRINVSAGTVSFAGAALATSLQINNNSGGADLIVADGASFIQIASLETIVLGNAATGDISGTYSISTGATYNANGTNTNAVTTVSGTGIIDNQGTLTSGAVARLAMTSGSRYIHAQNSGTIPLADWNANSTIEITGVTTTIPGNFVQPYGNFTWNSSLQTATFSFAALNNIIGDFSVQNTGTGAITLKNAGGDHTTNIGGDFNLSGGTVNINSTNNTQFINVLGDVTISGGLLTRSSGNANFNFSGITQTFTKTGGAISNTVNFTINSGATVDFGTSILDGSNGTFTLASGGKIITANPDGIRSAGAFGAVQVTGTRTYNSGADYEFRGATTGTFTTSTNPQVRNFTVNNTTGNVTLSQPMIVNGVLTLTDGELNTSLTNLLNLADGATVAGVSNASFINGPIRKTGDDAFTFPTGRSGAGYVPIIMSAPASTTTVMTAEYLRGTPPNASNITATGITHISGCDYWTLDHTAGTAPTISITLNWTANNPCGGASYVTDPTTIKAVHYNGTSWNTASLANGTGTAAAGSVTWTGVSVFSPFALGTTATDNNNPLPVLFNDVRAFEKNGGIQIEWSNLTERDLIQYVVQRSVNGRDFIDYSSFAPKSNQNDKADYTEFDAAPSKGANFYRIRVLEQGGKYIYSKVLRVDIGGNKKGFSIYPNPVIGKQVNLILTGVKQGTYNVRVVTTTGQDVFQKSIMTQASGITQTLVLPSTLKPGIYNLLVSGEGYSQNQLFIVQ
jgi:hypothetical protein